MKNSIGVSMGAVAGLAISLAAQAADLGRVPAYTPPPPLAPTWTSCYLGANAGGGWAQASISDPILGASIGSVAQTSLVGGGQFGCDYQVGLFVFGFQGTVDVTNIRATRLQPNGIVMNGFNAPWMETLTARVGFLVHPMALLYLKGGGAWMQQNLTMTAFGVSIATGNTTLGGWTAGGGVEFMFAPNWSAFVEYNYHSYGNNQAALTLLPGGPVVPFNINLDVKSQAVLVGVNFRFGDPLAPN
jgi:outer membrane immunogenic protein